MALTELTLDLFAPGMTPLHRAGLGGLAATLQALRSDEVPGLTWNLEPRRVTLTFDEDDAQALVRLVEAGMYCASGLIVFRAFEDLPQYTEQAKLHLNECLLGTLLQHNKALQPPGAKKVEKSLEVDGRQLTFSVKELTDFKHRSAAREDGLVDSKGRLTKSPLEVKGWAFPGAVRRHESASDTALSEPPERFLALLFAVVGVVPYKLHAARSSQKLSFALVIPELDDLTSFADARRRLVGKALSLSASGTGDAALRMYAALHSAGLLRRLRVRSCTTMALGTSPWAKQQKTRTEILPVGPPDELTLQRLEVLESCMPARLRPKKDGVGAFLDFPCWRQIFSENLARGQPLWRGAGSVLSDRESRDPFLKFDRRSLKEAVKAMMSKAILGTERQACFVQACHEALRHRFGALGDRIRKEGLDVRALFQREVEGIRVSLCRCKNSTTFRAAIVDFWARAGRTDALREKWREMLDFFEGEQWELARDLALLALVSYPGKEDEPGDEAKAGQAQGESVPND